MSDVTIDLDTRLNNIEESVEILQEQINMIIETIEAAMPKILSTDSSKKDNI
jgi:hypothetical protein